MKFDKLKIVARERVDNTEYLIIEDKVYDPIAREWVTIYLPAEMIPEGIYNSIKEVRKEIKEW